MAALLALDRLDSVDEVFAGAVGPRLQERLVECRLSSAFLPSSRSVIPPVTKDGTVLAKLDMGELTMLSMSRVDVPEWAPPLSVEFVNEGGEESQHTCSALQDRVDSLVCRSVNSYVNDGHMVSDNVLFPRLSSLSGEYYVYEEMYGKYEDEGAIYYSKTVRCCCTRWGNRSTTSTYLGLDVGIFLYGPGGELKVVGIDSSAM